MESEGFDFNCELVLKGMQDELAKKPSPLTEEEYEQALGQIQAKHFEEVATTNLKEANDFLQKNRTQEGVIALDEKLQYKLVEAGKGPLVTEESTPLIHYEGKLLDGTVFASSMSSGGPISVAIQDTIAGFSKGLVGMKEGEKRQLFIHPDFAYGAEGHLPPNSLLIFEVTIVQVETTESE